MLVKEFLEIHKGEDLEVIVFEPVADEEYIYSVEEELLEDFGEYLIDGEDVQQDDFGTYIMEVINPYTKAYTTAVDAYLVHHEMKDALTVIRKAVYNEDINANDAMQIIEDILNEF